MSNLDRVIGVAVGLLVGVALVILFVFGGGSEQIDSPALDTSPPAVEAFTRPDPEQTSHK